jgi:hypothetical protein
VLVPRLERVGDGLLDLARLGLPCAEADSGDGRAGVELDGRGGGHGDDVGCVMGGDWDGEKSWKKHKCGWLGWDVFAPLRVRYSSSRSDAPAQCTGCLGKTPRVDAAPGRAGRRMQCHEPVISSPQTGLTRVAAWRRWRWTNLKRDNFLNSLCFPTITIAFSPGTLNDVRLPADG